jgi:hypothetical protein
MSKFGWSYPPGVTEAMLPGNSPAEQEQEAMIESLYEAIAPLRKFYTDADDADVADATESAEDEVVTALEQLMGEAYAKGHSDAHGDEVLIHELNPSPLHDYERFLKENDLEEAFKAFLITQPTRS